MHAQYRREYVDHEGCRWVETEGAYGIPVTIHLGKGGPR